MHTRQHLRGENDLTAGSGASTLQPLHTAAPPPEPDTALASSERRRSPSNSHGKCLCLAEV